MVIQPLPVCSVRPRGFSPSLLTAGRVSQVGQLPCVNCWCCMHSCHHLSALSDDDVQLQEALQLIIWILIPSAKMHRRPAFDSWTFIVGTTDFEVSLLGHVPVEYIVLVDCNTLDSSIYFLSIIFCNVERSVSPAPRLSVCPLCDDPSDLILLHGTTGSAVQHLDSWQTHAHTENICSLSLLQCRISTLCTFCQTSTYDYLLQ